MSNIGSWSFIIGLIIAVLVGLFAEASGVLVTVLVILGLIVGFLNISDKEVNRFLVASIALILSGLAGDFLAMVPAIGDLLQRIVSNFMILVAPAAIVVSVKAIYALAKD